MAPAPLLSRSAATVLAAGLVLMPLSACKPGATAQNNVAAPLVVDGNFDDANFVVPSDEGSGDENMLMPADPANVDSAAAAGGNAVRHNGAAHR